MLDVLCFIIINIVSSQHTHHSSSRRPGFCLLSAYFSPRHPTTLLLSITSEPTSLSLSTKSRLESPYQIKLSIIMSDKYLYQPPGADTELMGGGYVGGFHQKQGHICCG
jgi:hypothetical protein